MRRFTLFFVMLLSVLGLRAADVPSGIISVGSNATVLETGKWYCLYNNGARRFVKESNANALTQTSTSPANLDAADALGYLVVLEDAGDGKYYIKTARGNYYPVPGSSVKPTGTSAKALTIAPIEGAEGHFTIAGSTYKFVAPSDGTELKGGTASTANSTGDWSFRAITTTAADELGGKALYNYQMGKVPTFVRLYNRRTKSSYLTATETGAKGAPKTNDLSSVWYMQKSGEGYSLRSASTGRFLSEGFANTSSGSYTVYVQFSPNNTGNDAYINLSQKADMGDKCMNLKQDGTGLTTWSADQGSDWAIELVEDVNMDEVRNNINNGKGYVKTLTDGKYYRVVNANKSNYMAEAADGVRTLNFNPESFSQLWKVGVNGSAITLQNAFSSQYVQNQTAGSNIYKTGTSPATHYIRSTGDEWEYTWYITNTPNAGWGMHSDAGNAVVYWSCDNPNNKWAFVETNITDEEVEAARGNYNAFQQLIANKATYQATLDNLFKDKACTELKDGVKDLTDAQLDAMPDFAALPQDIQNMVKKVKNGDWAYQTTKSAVTDSYEKFFRIAPYRVYSHYQKMSWREYTGQSNAFGKLSGPTSIVLNAGDVAYIYVDSEPMAECTLEVEIVPTEGVPGNHQTGATTPLHQGLNAVMATEQCLIYIFHQLDNPEKFLADYPDIKIHIEGGTVQGYFDLTRGMKNQDWKNMNELGMMQHSVCPVINLKSNNLVFAMHTQLVKDAIKKAHEQAGDAMEDVEFLLHLWNTIPVNEEKYQGLEEFEGRYNNIWNVFSVNYNYMFASTYGTYYNENTLSGCMNYYTSSRFDGDGSEGGPMWGPHHEMGHNHQATICVTGTMEASNNMFSNINTWEGGICDTRYASPQYNFDEYLAQGRPWNDRSIEYSCRMFTQLYFYFHAAGNHDRFLQELHKALRKDPIIKTQGRTTATTGESGYDVKGSQDYLHFAKKCCDVAQADLSEFFEAYGFFVPIEKRYVGDYADYVVTTTQKEIDEARAYMQKYPKKLGNIMFINDHQVRKKANPDNVFGYVPTRADGMRWQAAGSGDWAKEYYAYGSSNGGDIDSYDGHAEYDVDNDYYTISGGKITFKGKNYLGHKVYDKDGNLIWAVNKATATIPAAIKSMFPNDVVVVAAQVNMTDVPCPYYKSGTNPIYSLNVSFTDGTTKKWWADGNIDEYLPENAIAVVTSANYNDELLASRNVVNPDGAAKSIVLNGDQPACIPGAIQAENLLFTKSGEGMQALNLPFTVWNASTIADNVLVHADKVEAGKPVVVDGAVEMQLHNVAVNAGNHAVVPEGYVLVKSGDVLSAEAATGIAPFTYVWDSAATFSVADGISAPVHSAAATAYDLQGRRLQQVTRPGLYIVDGRKVVVK